MSVASVPSGTGLVDPSRGDPFRHEALFYSSEHDFVERVAAFIHGGLAAGEPVLVLVVAPKIEMLRRELGADSARVMFGDMAEIGRNPGRIIPVWREFVATHSFGGHRRVRGIGEPIWATRTLEELVEVQRHESLINLAFAGAPAWVLCPYDRTALDRSVVDEAHRSHPYVTIDGIEDCSRTYRGLEAIARPFDDPLTEAPATAEAMIVTAYGLTALRAFVTRRATDFGFRPAGAEDLVLAVNEIATNSLRHGRGRAMLRIWTAGGEMICEVTDEGEIDKPLAGRQRPAPGDDSGFGLWMANQLCDLVQMRSFANGSVVRVRMAPR